MHKRLVTAASALVTLAVVLGWTEALDVGVHPRLDAGGRGWAFVTHFADTASQLAVGFSAAGLLWLLRRRLEAGIMVGLTAATLALTWSLKLLIGRDRPPSLLDPSSPAFPSGHALGATAVYVGLVVLAAPGDRRAMLVAAGVAAAIGTSRLALGVHYVTDVIGGWLMGAALVILAHDLRSSMQAKRDAAPPRS